MTILTMFRGDAVAAVPQLLRILNEPASPSEAPREGYPPDLDSGCVAAITLGSIARGSAAAGQVIKELMKVVQAGPALRRGWAAHALGEFGSEAEVAVPVLFQLIQEAGDNQFDRGTLAVAALGKIAPGTALAGKAVATLLPLLDSSNEGMKSVAIQSLGHFGGKAASALPKLHQLKASATVNSPMKYITSEAIYNIENTPPP